MDQERLLFRHRRHHATSKQINNKKVNRSLCIRGSASQQLVFLKPLVQTAPFPELNKTQAILTYMDTFKNLEKVLDKRKHEKAADSPVCAYLTKVKENRLVPGTVGMLSKCRTQQSLDLSHYSIGNIYADALAEGIRLVKLSRAVFKNNRLSDQGAFDLVNKINPRYLNELDLSENLIGLKTISKICAIIELNFAKLTVLNLDSNNLGDRSTVLMCSVLSNFDKLTSLGLANNQITEYGASALGKYLKQTHTLEKLDLHWNSIKGEGAQVLAEALSDNNSVKVLDLSFNSFSSPAGVPVKSLAKAIRQNIKIYHLDLSNNGFNENDCKVLAEALSFNTTIIGLHMEGNGARIDEKGFLKIDVLSCRARNLHIYKPLMSQKRRKDPNCWVCQKWNEVTIVVRGGFKTVFLHLELYGFEKDEMEKINDGNFKACKICPPGKVKFFFSSESRQIFTTDYPADILQNPICLNEMIITEQNYLINKECSQIMWRDFFPRAHPRYQVNNLSSFSWESKTSIFRDYQSDTSKLLDHCFDYDMSLSNSASLLTESKDHSLRLLKQNYPIIKDLHKYLYSLSCSSWKAWQENICEAFSSRAILDGSVLKTNDLIAMIKLVKTSNSEVQSEMARFQFLELIVRVALVRYHRGGLISQLEAIESIAKEIALIGGTAESNEFRNKKYWNFAVDKVLKKHREWILNCFSSIEKDGVVSFKDFAKVVARYSRNDELAFKCCYLAKETKRYAKYIESFLKFAEFLEAFCRFVDCERVDHDLKKLSLDVLMDIVINDYFKNKKN
jgi:Ran GTPase-activating protein (RanGAP) involved in mRNA processing and transport